MVERKRHAEKSGNADEDNDDEVAVADNEKGFIETSSCRLAPGLTGGALCDRRLDSVPDLEHGALEQNDVNFSRHNSLVSVSQKSHCR
jgi:hypothetical protein